MFKPVIPTAKLAGFCSDRFTEHICSFSKQRSPRLGTNGFATCSSECRLAMKPSPCLDGWRVREPFVIWANGIPIRKTILIHLVSIDWNGAAYLRSGRTSGQCLLLSSGEKLCMSNWYRVQVVVRCLPLWNSYQPHQRRPGVPLLGSQAAPPASCRIAAIRPYPRIHPPARLVDPGLHASLAQRRVYDRMWAVLLFNSTNHGVFTINGRAAGRCLFRSAYRQHQQPTNVRFIGDKGQAFFTMW